jgi:hypothetical protein
MSAGFIAGDFRKRMATPPINRDADPDSAVPHLVPNPDQGGKSFGQGRLPRPSYAANAGSTLSFVIGVFLFLGFAFHLLVVHRSVQHSQCFEAPQTE